MEEKLGIRRKLAKTLRTWWVAAETADVLPHLCRWPVSGWNVTAKTFNDIVRHYATGGGGAGAVGGQSTGVNAGGIAIANAILGTSYSSTGGPGGNGGGGGGAVDTTGTGGTGFNNGSHGTNGCSVCWANVPGGNAGANTGGGGGDCSHNAVTCATGYTGSTATSITCSSSTLSTPSGDTSCPASPTQTGYTIATGSS